MVNKLEKFSEFEYKRPDPEATIKAINEVVLRIKMAKSLEEVKTAFEDYHKISMEFNNATNISYIRHSMDTRDEFYKSEKEFTDEYGPIVGEKSLEVEKQLLKSAFRNELEAEYGKLLFVKMENNIKSIDEKVISLMQEENTLCSKYNQICASAQIPFEGGIYTISQLRPFKLSSDRNLRRKAYVAEGQFYESYGRELDELFDKLVKNRTAQAHAMGMEDFTELGNIRMGRIGYSKEDLVNYRKQVVDDLVPAASEIISLQQKRIGIKNWKGYDNTLVFADGNPTPKGTPEEILASGQKMYHGLSKETADFIDEMMERDLFDVLSSEGKEQGGYCSYIEKQKCSFIFANFNGTAGDVDVLTHEAGHAFAGYRSFKKNLIPEYFTPSAEACEVHSIAMEYLTEDFHELFFKEDTKKYELMHKERGITFIPSACLADEFQYRVYENPNWTPEERHAEWRRLEKIYQPHLTDFEDIPFYGRGARWQSVLHIMVLPFYYVDYALAQTVALQLWAEHLQDKEAAWKRYIAFVEQAGTKTFTKLVTDVNLKSPFEEGCIKGIVEPAMKWIHENQL